MTCHHRRVRGVSTLELLVGMILSAGLLSASVPAIWRVYSQTSMRAAAREVATFLAGARDRAVLRGCNVGVRWIATGGDLLFSVYEDGNGDGVRNADIRSGVDLLVSGPHSIKARYPRVTFSFLPELPAVDPAGDPLGDLGDPIRLGRSDICSFSPTGTASPGSVYLSEGRIRQMAVRISPITGRIKIYEWSTLRRAWIATS